MPWSSSRRALPVDAIVETDYSIISSLSTSWVFGRFSESGGDDREVGGDRDWVHWRAMLADGLMTLLKR